MTVVFAFLRKSARDGETMGLLMALGFTGALADPDVGEADAGAFLVEEDWFRAILNLWEIETIDNTGQDLTKKGQTIPRQETC